MTANDYNWVASMYGVSLPLVPWYGCELGAYNSDLVHYLRTT
jgi:hypothetical protein